MKGLIKAFLVSMSGILLFYTLIGFVRWDFDPAGWSEDARYLLAFLSAYAVGGGVVVGFVK